MFIIDTLADLGGATGRYVISDIAWQVVDVNQLQHDGQSPSDQHSMMPNSPSVDVCYLLISLISAYFFLIKVPAHHSALASAALAEGSKADCIKICSPRVQVSSQVCTCIPYRRALSGGRCQGSSATPFQFILITDHQPYPYCLPSVTKLFQSPLLVSGTVCLILSLPHLL